MSKLLEIQLPPFQPHPLAWGGHLQTIVGAYYPWKKKYRPPHVLVDTNDGDKVVMYDDHSPDWRPGERVVLLIHGLGGSHESGYMVRTAQKLHERGVRSFRKELRGFGSSYAIARGHCHAGRGEDIAVCVEKIIQLCPDSPITLIGYSMGANILLNLLGELGDLAPAQVDSAIAVAPPIDLPHCAHNLRQGLNRLYDWSFMRTLQRLLQQRRRVVKDFHDRRVRPLPNRLRDFDEQFVAPLIGFPSAHDYYVACSAAYKLPHITVPTMIISAEDDPIVPVDMFHRHAMSPSIALHTTRSGGHLGFIGRQGPDPDIFWLDWRTIEIVQSLPLRFGESAASQGNSCESHEVQPQSTSGLLT